MARLATAAAALALLLLAASGVDACIYLYGTRNEAEKAKFAYGNVGLDWPEAYETCKGSHQSPIFVPTTIEFPRVPGGEESVFSYGKSSSSGDNWRVVNNGHTVLLMFPESGYTPPNASAVAKGPTLVSKFDAAQASAAPKRVSLKPIQAHFHTHSEHIIDGKVYPLEMHIVNFVYDDQLPACGNASAGCAAVVGIMFELAEGARELGPENKFINTLFNSMPQEEGESSFLPTGAQLDFDDVMPSDRSYVTYSGSLTTPPCSENILWHVLVNPVKITRDQLHKFQLAVGESDCTNSTGQPQAGYSKSDGGLSCRKLVNGQNFREAQDRQGRPILFHAAAGVCDAGLARLPSDGILSRMLRLDDGGSSSMSLQQYSLLAAANLTAGGANCAQSR